MPHTHTPLAEKLMRAWNQVRRARGIVLGDEGGLWILSRPTFPRQQTRSLLGALLEPSPSRQELARRTGASEILRIDGPRLGKLTYNLRLLEDRRTIRKLIQSGVQPMASLRGTDIEGRLDADAARIEHLANMLATGQFPMLPTVHHPPVERLLQRMAWIWDDQVAKRAADLIQDATYMTEGERTLIHGVSRFQAIVRSWRRGVPPRDGEASEVVERLERLPVGTSPRLLLMASIFFDLLPPRLRSGLPSYADFAAISLQDGVDDLDTMVRVLGERVVAVHRQRQDQVQAGPVMHRKMPVVDLATVAVHHPHLELRLPATASDAMVKGLVHTALERPSTHLDVLWNAALESPRAPSPYGGHFPPHLDGKLLAECVREGLTQMRWMRDNRALRAYLRTHRALAQWDLDSADTALSDLFSKHPPETTTLIADMLANCDSARTLVICMHVAQDLVDNPRHPAFEAAHRWFETTARLDADQRALVAQLEINPQDARRYLHLRHLSGQGHTFSEAILTPRTLQAKATTEAAALRSRLDSATASRRHNMQHRLTQLEDPDVQRERMLDAIRAARRTFERSLESLEQESLTHTVDAIADGLLTHWLGHPIEGPRHKRRNAALLIGTRDVDPRLARRFFQTVVSDHPADAAAGLRAWPENTKYLQTLAECGVDVDAWSAGFRAVAEIGGKSVTFATEHDPFEVLQMGSHFNTCLSLGGGCNGASCLTNAVDANKQVIYGRRESGEVVARKLIGITPGGALVGFHTYAHQHIDQVRTTLGPLLAAWGRSIGLAVQNQGHPRSLHGAFWYDDGNEIWEGPDLEQDVEALYAMGFQDPIHWRRAAAGTGRFAEAARARLFHMGARSDTLPTSADMIGLRSFTYLSDVSPQFVWRRVCDIAGLLPDDPDVARLFCDRVGKLRIKKYTAELLPPIGWIGSLPFAEAVEQLATWLDLCVDRGVECVVENHVDCWETFCGHAATALRISWERGEDPRALARAVRRSRLPQLSGILASFREAPDVVRTVAITDWQRWRIDCGQSLDRWRALLAAHPEQRGEMLDAARSGLSPSAYAELTSVV